MHVARLKTEASLKVCIFGEGGVGKTTLTNRFVTGRFDINTKMTLGAEIFVKYMEIDDIKVDIQIWDFGGEEMFRFLLPSYSMGSNGGIFMFDLTRYGTLEKLDEWLEIFKDGLRDNEKNIPIIFVGGKADLQENRSVSREALERILNNGNFIDCIECSSKTGENIEQIFEILVRKILKDKGII